MADNKLTFKDLFLDQAGAINFGLEHADNLNYLIRASQIGNIKEMIERIPGIAWEYVWGKLQIEIGKILNIDFDDIILRTWKKCLEIQQYMDPNKYYDKPTPPISILDHTITSTHKPYIDIFVNGTCIAHIVFTITLQLKLEGIKLEIQGGEIRKVKAGACHAEGSLKIGDVPLLEKKLSFDLPGVITLTNGETPSLVDGKHCPNCGIDIGIISIVKAPTIDQIKCPACNVGLEYVASDGQIVGSKKIDTLRIIVLIVFAMIVLDNINLNNINPIGGVVVFLFMFIIAQLAPAYYCRENRILRITNREKQ